MITYLLITAGVLGLAIAVYKWYSNAKRTVNRARLVKQRKEIDRKTTKLKEDLKKLNIERRDFEEAYNKYYTVNPPDDSDSNS